MHYKELIWKLDREIQDASDELKGCELCHCDVEKIKDLALAICYLKKSDDIVDAMMLEHAEKSMPTHGAGYAMPAVPGTPGAHAMPGMRS